MTIQNAAKQLEVELCTTNFSIYQLYALLALQGKQNAANLKLNEILKINSLQLNSP